MVIFSSDIEDALKNITLEKGSKDKNNESENYDNNDITVNIGI